jgi:hypothetical protein
VQLSNGASLSSFSSPNHYTNFCSNTFSNLWRFTTQFNNSPGSNTHYASGLNLNSYLGEKVDVSFVYQMNTPGVADGIYEIWVNGVLVKQHTTVMYVLAGDPAAAFSGWKWEPTYGGGSGPVPRDLFMRCDAIRLFGGDAQ